MKIQELEQQYACLPQLKALASELGKSSGKTIFLEGLLASSAPMLFASLSAKSLSFRMLRRQAISIMTSPNLWVPVMYSSSPPVIAVP